MANEDLGYDYLNWARENFTSYIGARSHELADQPEDYRYLLNYIATWLEQGDAVETTGGRFDTYMRVVVRIIDAWTRDPTLDGSIRHPVDGILSPEDDSYLAISPEYFAARALQRQIPRETEYPHRG